MTQTTDPAESPPSPLRAAQRLHDTRPWATEEAGLRALLVRLPANGDAMRRLGLLAANRSAFDEATLWFRAALVAVPNRAQAHVDLGIALRQQGHGAEAAGHFTRAAELEPANTGLQLMARLAHANQLDEQGRSAEALAAFHDAAVQHPDSADAWACLGNMQRFLANSGAAVDSFQRALQLDPDRLEVMELFARTLRDLRRNEEAAVVLEHLLKSDPERPQVAGLLMHCKLDLADWTGLDRLNQHIAAGIAADKIVAEPFLLLACCNEPELLLRAARHHAASQVPDRSSDWPSVQVGREGKIRIGYVAGEFRNHAVAWLLTGMFEQHDHSRFEVYAFDTAGGDNSPLRRRIEAALHIVPVRGLSLDAAMQAVRSRQIDILVNLNGYSGVARHDLFAARAAPIQVNYLGYPGTTGMPYIDYLVADPVLIPPDNRCHFSEQVIYLPDSYQPNDKQRRIGSTPASRAELGLPEDAFVFCCMNHIFKIMPKVFDVWMRVLLRVPGSVLMLYSDNAPAQQNLRHEAAVRGVAPGRLHFGGPIAPEHHLARLGMCDLFLDSAPYNAHTSGSDALWVGLPVLSCSGRTFPSRVGASLLNAVGLPELAVDSFEAYEALAVRLATEPGLLAALRQRLKANLPTAALFDAPRYTRHLEAAYSQMVARARAGLAPEAFAVACEEFALQPQSG